jgi:hypothetical protein
VDRRARLLPAARSLPGQAGGGDDLQLAVPAGVVTQPDGHAGGADEIFDVLDDAGQRPAQVGRRSQHAPELRQGQQFAGRPVLPQPSHTNNCNINGPRIV